METRSQALVIGAGPAGLMAAERLAAAGARVLVAEAMPSPGRKFLMAGKSGLNLTQDTDLAGLLPAYGAAADWLAPMLAAFDAAAVQDWARGLGQAVFTGSSGRVFPVVMKASPLLRAWLARLDAGGVALRTRWRWRGWEGEAHLFDTPEGPQRLRAGITVLALGGASWARLGADGAWAATLAGAGIACAPFRPANMGFAVDWSAPMARWFGHPVKPVAVDAGGGTQRGEFVIAAGGVEGGGIYAVSAALRDRLGPDGGVLTLDLLPDLDVAQVAERLDRPRGRASLSNHLRKTLGLAGARAALARECAGAGLASLPPGALAACLKALPLRVRAPYPMDSAISTAGGLEAAALDADLMLRARPGTYAAGEMLDWEAPTGGYLLTGCLATGAWAGAAAARRLGLGAHDA